MSIWHRIEHKLGWYKGHVVSRSDQNGRIYIGFMCSMCCKVMSEHDATNLLNRHIDAHLIHNALK